MRLIITFRVSRIDLTFIGQDKEMFENGLTSSVNVINFSLRFFKINLLFLSFKLCLKWLY